VHIPTYNNNSTNNNNNNPHTHTFAYSLTTYISYTLTPHTHACISHTLADRKRFRVLNESDPRSLGRAFRDLIFCVQDPSPSYEPLYDVELDSEERSSSRLGDDRGGFDTARATPEAHQEARQQVHSEDGPGRRDQSAGGGERGEEATGELNTCPQSPTPVEAHQRSNAREREAQAARKNARVGAQEARKRWSVRRPILSDPQYRKPVPDRVPVHMLSALECGSPAPQYTGSTDTCSSFGSGSRGVGEGEFDYSVSSSSLSSGRAALFHRVCVCVCVCMCIVVWI
jgi:hypothetical protein